MQPVKAGRALVCLVAILGLIVASPPKNPVVQQDTNSKPLTPKAAKAKENARRKELASGYRVWLDQDVAYIISPEEHSAFMKLQNDDEREQFIEQFWLRRDPTPDTEENEFREEHYRRIAYANERFASGIPGWRTDRGRMYIVWGPPDEIEDHSSGGFYERPPEEGGGSTSAFPFQRWRYRHLDGVGENIVILFVDDSMSGEFYATTDASKIDALLYVPGAGLSAMESMGLADKSQRFNNTNGTHLPAAFGGTPESMNQFTLMEQQVALFKPPALKFPDLEQVTSSIRYNQLPMQVRVDYFPVTQASVLAVITVQFKNSDLQFQARDGGEKALLEISGKIETMSHRRIATPFDDEARLFVPEPMFSEYARNKSIYQKIVPLRPGQYRLTITAKDVVAGNYAVSPQPLNVPRLDPDQLTASSVVLADILEAVPPKEIGAGPFVIGDMKVRPRVDRTFQANERVGIYLNVYNFSPNPVTHKPSGQVTYELKRKGSTETVAVSSDDIAQFPHASPSQVTVQKFLNLSELHLAPGAYTVTVKVSDLERNHNVTAAAELVVR